MPRKILQFGAISLGAMLAMGWSAFAQGQRRIAPLPRPPLRMGQRNAQERRILDLPPKWVERVQQMTPEEQEKFLSNNERFHNLPPERQAQIRQQLQRWNNLTPEQRQTLLQREQVLERLTPEERQYVRDTLVPQWRSMPPARRQLVLQKLRDLRDLSDSQRTAKLGDEQFMDGLDPNERQMLRDLSTLRLNNAVQPPG